MKPLRWRHNGYDGVSNHQPHHCLLNRLFGRRSKKTSKPRVTGLCAGNSPETGEFPAQMASDVENVSISWRHHGVVTSPIKLSHVIIYPYSSMNYISNKKFQRNITQRDISRSDVLSKFWRVMTHHNLDYISNNIFLHTRNASACCKILWNVISTVIHESPSKHMTGMENILFHGLCFPAT